MFRWSSGLVRGLRRMGSMRTFATDRRPAAPRPFRDVLNGFEDAMLLTSSELRPGRLRGRSLLIARLDDDATFWLFAAAEDGRVREVLHDAESYVVCLSPRHQVFMRGRIAIVDDMERFGTLWNEEARLRFRAEDADADVLLLAFMPETAEYWDHSGMKGLRYYLDAERTSFRGDLVIPTSAR